MHSKNIQLFYRPGDEAICGMAPTRGGVVTISFPASTLKAMWKNRPRFLGDDGPETIEGFFDFVKKAIKTVAKIANNPLVKAAVGMIPYGGTALAVLEAGDKALGSAKKAIAKKPGVHATIHKALKGDPRSKAALLALPPKAQKKAAVAVKLQKEAKKVAIDLRAAKAALRRAGYTPGLVRALQLPAAPWR